MLEASGWTVFPDPAAEGRKIYPPDALRPRAAWEV